MAKISKGGKSSSQKVQQSEPKVVYIEKSSEYKCVKCGKIFENKENSFPRSRSQLYAGNDFYLPICRGCFNDEINQYAISLGSSKEAIQRMCARWDYYLDEERLNNLKFNSGSAASDFSKYIMQLNLGISKDKCYDDYLAEKANELAIRESEYLSMKEYDPVTEETKMFFGDGYTLSEFRLLQKEYDDWLSRHECETKAQEEIFKNLCIASLNIQRAQRDGGNVKDAMKTFQDLLSTANLQPKQIKKDPFGVKNTPGMLAKMIEMKRPIVLEDPELNDVDNMAKYHRVWYTGAMSSCFGIANPFAEEYEEEIAKYTVSKPEYTEEDDVVDISSIFGDGD